MFTKNNLYNVNITDMNDSGNGVCKINGAVVFVIGGVCGDVCRIKIIKVAKKYAVAAIDTLITPSPYRIDPVCKYKRCGGCAFQNISPEYENELKKNIVSAAFLRAGVSLPVGEVTFSGDFYNYRNKAQFPVGYDKSGKLNFGYYAEKSHDVIFCESCSITKPAFAEIAKTVCQKADKYGVSAYSEESGGGILRHICIRSGISGVMLTLVINAGALPKQNEFIKDVVSAHREITGVFLNINKENTNVIYGDKFINVYGDNTLTDELCGLRFEIAPASFYQVNHDCCEALYNKAASLLDIKGTETVVDLYCGVGTVGMCAAKNAKKLIGIEIIPEAVENAKRNAKINGFDNAEFYCGDSSIVKSVVNGKVDALIVDPPRKGLSDDVIKSIIDIKPEKLLYISCDPNTLARDLQKLLTNYTADCAYPFNMFPRTGHVETVVLMTKK
ncbi:MAG: 23S rRNA (uracil(1939)-C(5))-methyltransferase RlmD [Clostridia bacterium]|nr:23S rRNA (uracil(1939)-C(5))-methyltransferase RlmD [Clostridia bacterium]